MRYSHCEESGDSQYWNYVHSLWLSEQAAIDRAAIADFEAELQFRDFMASNDAESFGVEYGQADQPVPATKKIARKGNRTSSVE